ncbi:hypothetical protein [Clostridium weizhouense]|uniref:Uncharacterized protein n=1 Tax=Clostridium weizhouense TaxID=2859781 RepID=A0ABS7API5_9CLOT|nr:hypothetical protein [Clostridium weizhouense]MBW6410336.1 hypothetical protein [Clostridium weizhouense]
MHREVVVRKKAPVIATLILVITIMLYLYQGISNLQINNIIIIKAINSLIIMLTVSIVFLQLARCKIAYKYSIIANKLIINKIISNQEKNLESISLSEIVYIGKKYYIPKEYVAKNKGNYFCEVINTKSYCCIYKKQDQYYKFSFNPSDKLIQRLNTNNKIKA